MIKLIRILSLGVLWFSSGVHCQDELKSDAVRRLVDAHDPSVFVVTGALYLKQVALRAAGGKELSPATRQAVDLLIDSSVRDTAWFDAGWGAAIDRYLTAEEADEIATHFATEGGQLQRRVIELTVGEVLLSNYTFTDRIDYRIVGSSSELKALQTVVDERQFKGIQDFFRYPEAIRFASGGAGVKYMKMLMIQGVEAITTHFETVATQIRKVVEISGPKSE